MQMNMQVKKVGLIMLALLLVTSLTVLAQEEVQQQTQGEVVAEVNGEKLSMAELEQIANTQQLIMQLFQMDQEFAQLLYSSEPGQKLLTEYRKRKLDQLIEQKLLKLKAQEENISLTEDEKEDYFQNHLEQVKTQNNISEDELVNALQQQGIDSLESYRELFLSNSNLTINKLLEKEVYSKIKVTDEEARKVYEDKQENGEYEDKSFAEVKEQIKNNIRQQQQQQAQQEYINTLKEEANIEKYL